MDKFVQQEEQNEETIEEIIGDDIEDEIDIDSIGNEDISQTSAVEEDIK